MSKLQEPKSGWYSGRVTGIPVAGAIGGGDDFAQRIAKPYVPGRPSQGGMSTSADTTFSLTMGQTLPDPEIEQMSDFNPEEIAPGKVLQRPLPRVMKLNKQKYFHKTIAEMMSCIEDDDLSHHEMLDAELRDDRGGDEIDEFSGVGAIAGYVEPMHGPVGSKADKRKFYNRMAKPYGAKYLIDPLKAAKGRP